MCTFGAQGFTRLEALSVDEPETPAIIKRPCFISAKNKTQAPQPPSPGRSNYIQVNRPTPSSAVSIPNHIQTELASNPSVSICK